MNYAEKMTEIMLSKTETYLYKSYARASVEVNNKWKEYIKGYTDQDGVYHKGLADRIAEQKVAYDKKLGNWANMTDTQARQKWNEYVQSQIGRGERWEQLKNDLANLATDTNKSSASYVNGDLSDVYDLNANYTAYNIEKTTGVTSFTLVNTNTAEILSSGENHVNFKTLSVNPKRDYAWNEKKIQGSLLQGILQGESIDKISNRFMQVMTQNRNAAVRNARTAYTSAQNAGCLDSMNKASDMGIEMQKEWIATTDDRTRDSHAELDGVRVGKNEAFPNGLEYPGDPKGIPAEVYNCRCTMRSIIINVNDEKRTSEIAGHEGSHDEKSYKAWLKAKVEEFY